MLTCSLQSGSNGNAIYVEAGGVALLFDAGISGLQAQKRLAEHDRDIRRVDALLISHDHNDHVRCAGVYQRKFGLPIYITPRTRAALWCSLGKVHDVRPFTSGDTLSFGAVGVHTVPTPHDAADGVGFIIEHEGKRLAILTDLGHPFAGLLPLLRSVDAAYLECNYDPDLLDNGPYPPQLKARIRGPHGHLSNDEAAELLRHCGRHRPHWVAAAHLSEENNLPDLALDALQTATGRDYPVYLASRYHVSDMLTV
ncbi:MAG TPA: MBL fold metallo-hydrolase [Phycisphaerae bacterium]|nr:MBL fold metallo-hydrolase [Phycisphaerae bacterium]HNU46440.1 MBL fold metallo-hydrolase [Phycisphaerae bacterium]